MPVSNLTERTKIQRVISGVYADICAKSDWWWLQRRTIINTVPKINTGTVSVTANSTSITFSTAPQQFSTNVSVAGFVLIISGNVTDANAVYRILSHTSGLTAATLDAAYTGATDTAAGFNLYQVSYDLPADCAKLLYVKRFGDWAPLRRVGIEDISALQMSNQAEGKPWAYSIFDFDTNNTVSTSRQLQIVPYPDQSYRLEVWYKHLQINDTSSDLDLPLDFQQVLIYGAIAHGYPIFLNDPDRGGFFLSKFNDVMALMTAQQREYASDHPGVSTDMTMYRRNSTRGRRSGYSMGRFFDTWPNVP